MGIINCLPSATHLNSTFSGDFSVPSGPRIISGHILTGFSSSGGFIYPRTPADTLPEYDMTKPFHIRMKLRCSGLMTRGQALIGDSASEFARPVIVVGSQGADYLAQGNFSTDGTTWGAQLSVLKSEIPFVADAWYTIDYEWGLNTFSFTVSDGTNTVTKTTTITNFTTVADGGTSRVQIGARKAQLYAQNVSVDAFDTYWEQNGSLVWGNKS